MSERVLRGVGVSPGVAFAPVVAVRWSFPEVPDRNVPPEQHDAEIARLHEAVAAVLGQLAQLRDRTAVRAGPEEARIFDAQMMMVQDPTFIASVETLIRKNNLSAETAYEFKALELRNAWQGSRQAMLRDRLADLNAIQLRMLAHLLGRATDEAWLGEIDQQVVILARELSPGLTVQFDREHVVGFICEEGTRTSHAAILAHSLGIPAVMGVPRALDRIAEGAIVLLDGQSGVIIIDPTHDELEVARLQTSRRHKLELQLEGIASSPAETPDGVRIKLQGNVDLPEEVEPALRHGAEGVGLLRTEFLVSGRATLPTEDEQTEYYRRVGAAFAGQPVVVRSYDLGGDKFPAAFASPQEANPFLGWRSIRVCLDEPGLFRPQLRAILRAAADRDLWLMLPLVISLDEVLETRAILAEEAESLRRDGIRAAADVPVGVMIETPAAVTLAAEFAQVSAFLSVGSNDLTQYTLAVDRGNARLAARFSPLHPAVVRALRQVRLAAAAAGIPSSVCGEMASDPISAVLLLGLGYDRLSIAPPSIPLVKWVVRSMPMAAAREAAEAAAAATTTAAVETILREAVGRHLDLRLVDPAGALPHPSTGTSLPRSP
ncbi:MAG: phosphoenolpyruvate--protein phosphotransferase [Gemmatimonadetes bacterium]|jgi:phosphotransferase system enzyme I (PtsI)|nr:phosphoenolpyruvate--protein phosphotransferase [Gemmatimonadota bacterium]MBK9549013.1 phosphoenolpyruvate--protein phosphotransferase [Gemmatimonadota bacterium]